MRKSVFGLLGIVATVTFGTSVSAQVSNVSYNTDVAVFDDQGVTFAAGFLDLGGPSPFDNFVTFTEALAGTYGFTLTTTNSGAGTPQAAAGDLDFTAAWLSDGLGGTWNLFPDADNNDVNEDWGRAGLFLPAGTYTLHIQGTRGSNASYEGGIAFAAVPEPATWAMMLIGFGAVGYSMRRRRKPGLPQIA